MKICIFRLGSAQWGKNKQTKIEERKKDPSTRLGLVGKRETRERTKKIH